MERTKPRMILSARLWVCVLQNTALSAVVVTPDGEERGPVVEIQGIPDAVRAMPSAESAQGTMSKSAQGSVTKKLVPNLSVRTSCPKWA